MGNCLARCFGTLNRKRKYLKSRYNETDQSIEVDSDFENLMDDEGNQDEMSRLLTDHERQLLKSRQFDAIVHEQTKIDKEVDEQLAHQEEELKREEESYFEAKNEAARIAKLQRAKKEAAKKNATINGSRSWLGDEEEWEVAGGEDDFEIFLANVKARSLLARAQVHAGQAGDAQSSSSSTVLTKERSLTEGSSLDLEWDHEAGVEPLLHSRSHTEENLSELTSLHNMATASSQHSSDLEWDNTFVSADDLEQRLLLGTNAASGHSSRR